MWVFKRDVSIVYQYIKSKFKIHIVKQKKEKSEYEECHFCFCHFDTIHVEFIFFISQCVFWMVGRFILSGLYQRPNFGTNFTILAQLCLRKVTALAVESYLALNVPNTGCGYVSPSAHLKQRSNGPALWHCSLKRISFIHSILFSFSLILFVSIKKTKYTYFKKITKVWKNVCAVLKKCLCNYKKCW